MEYKVWLSAFKTLFVSVCVRGRERLTSCWKQPLIGAEAISKRLIIAHRGLPSDLQMITTANWLHSTGSQVLSITMILHGPVHVYCCALRTCLINLCSHNLATSNQTGLWYWCCCCPVRHSMTFLQLYPGGILFNVQHSDTRSIWTVNPDFRSPLLLPLEKCSLSI